MLTIRFVLLSVLLLQGATGLRAQDCASLSWEANLTRDINTFGGSGWRSASRVVSGSLPVITLGIPIAFALSGSAAGDRDVSLNGVVTGTTMLATYGSVFLAKAAFARTRPYLEHPTCITGYSSETDGSMPSGHSAGTAALAMALSLQYPEWYVIVPSATYALATGLSRMHLGMHYISDVLIGYAMGAGIAYIVHLLRADIERLFDPLLPSKSSNMRWLVPITPVINITFGL